MTTAAAAYAAKTASVEAKLAEIQTLLAQHAQRAGGAPKNWGYAGDLAHVDSLLAQVVHALGGTPVEA